MPWTVWGKLLHSGRVNYNTNRLFLISYFAF